jgi:hypothetical protein
MNKTTGGWIIFIIALGMMCGLMASDVSRLNDWSGARSPQFVSVIMAHFSSVVLAFVGGKLIPETRASQHTRSGDE